MTDLSAKLPHASATVRAQNPGLFGIAPEKTEQDGAQDELPGMPAHEQTEKRMQDEFHNWLKLLGFRPRTPQDIQRHHLGLWYIHLHKPVGNPILMDTILIDSTRGAHRARCIEIELKIKGGRLSPEQRCMEMRGECVVAWDLDQAKDAVKVWRKMLMDEDKAKNGKGEQ